MYLDEFPELLEDLSIELALELAGRILDCFLAATCSI